MQRLEQLIVCSEAIHSPEDKDVFKVLYGHLSIMIRTLHLIAYIEGFDSKDSEFTKKAWKARNYGYHHNNLMALVADEKLSNPQDKINYVIRMTKLFCQFVRQQLTAGTAQLPTTEIPLLHTLLTSKRDDSEPEKVGAQETKLLNEIRFDLFSDPLIVETRLLACGRLGCISPNRSIRNLAQLSRHYIDEMEDGGDDHELASRFEVQFKRKNFQQSITKAWNQFNAVPATNLPVHLPLQQILTKNRP